MAETTETKPKLVTVLIDFDGHEHNGQPVAKGEKIEVDEETAAWIKAHKDRLKNEAGA